MSLLQKSVCSYGWYECEFLEFFDKQTRSINETQIIFNDIITNMDTWKDNLKNLKDELSSMIIDNSKTDFLITLKNQSLDINKTQQTINKIIESIKSWKAIMQSFKTQIEEVEDFPINIINKQIEDFDNIRIKLEEIDMNSLRTSMKEMEQYFIDD